MCINKWRILIILTCFFFPSIFSESTTEFLKKKKNFFLTNQRDKQIPQGKASIRGVVGTNRPIEKKTRSQAEKIE